MKSEIKTEGENHLGSIGDNLDGGHFFHRLEERKDFLFPFSSSHFWKNFPIFKDKTFLKTIGNFFLMCLVAVDVQPDFISILS